MVRNVPSPVVTSACVVRGSRNSFPHSIAGGGGSRGRFEPPIVCSRRPILYPQMRQFQVRATVTQPALVAALRNRWSEDLQIDPRRGIAA